MMSVYSFILLNGSAVFNNNSKSIYKRFVSLDAYTMLVLHDFCPLDVAIQFGS